MLLTPLPFCSCSRPFSPAAVVAYGIAPSDRYAVVPDSVPESATDDVPQQPNAPESKRQKM
jgi:hypothetical protein